MIPKNKSDNLCDMKDRNRKNFNEENKALTVLSLPTLLWYIAFCYFPLFGIVIAFKRYRLIPGKSFIYSLFFGSEWAGFSNFRFLFLNPQIWQVLRNTLLYNIVFLILGTVIPVALAIVLSYIRSSKIRSAVQVLMLLPYFLSWVIVSYFVYAFLSADKGMINTILKGIGEQTVNFYKEPSVWPFVLVIVMLWKSSGYSMLLYYANIMGIDPQLYDLAAVDGAGVFQVIRHVIIPSLKNVIIVMVLLNLGHILSSDFGLFYQVTRNSGSIGKVTQTIDVFVFKALTEQSNYGFSAAASLMQNGIGCIILLIADRMIKRIDPEGGVL